MKQFKRIIGLVIVLSICISCSKTSTCTCKDSSGAVLSVTSETSSRPGGLDDFNKDCENASTTTTMTSQSGNGPATSTSTTTACELTKD